MGLQREFPKLMANHSLRNLHLVVDLAVMNKKYKSYKIRQDGCRTSHGLDWRHALAQWWANNWESAKKFSVEFQGGASREIQDLNIRNYIWAWHEISLRTKEFWILSIPFQTERPKSTLLGYIATTSTSRMRPHKLGRILPVTMSRVGSSYGNRLPLVSPLCESLVGRD